MMDSQAVRPGRIEGYAIVSEDGMLADATGVMPDSLKFDADQKFLNVAWTGSTWWYMGATLVNGICARNCGDAW